MTPLSLAAQTRLILRNDLRLLWRDLKASRWKDFLNVGLAVVLFLVANAVSIALFFAFRHQPALGTETIAWFFFGFIMLGAAMNHSIRVLFERADFDLLLASPVSPRAILLARLLTMTIGAALSVAIFLLPLLHGAILAVSWHYLAGYAVWLLLSCAVASGGVWFTLLLVKWLGPQRARIWAQVVAAILGAGIYLITQIGQFLHGDAQARFFDAAGRILSQPAFSFVSQAARGAWPSLAILAVVTALFGALTTRLLARMFITGVQEAGGISPGKKRGDTRPYVFVDGVMRATFWKDLRLIVRDPLLLAQILPTALYLLPAFFAFSRWGGVALLAPLTLVIATQFSSMLTTVAAAGEECWDLIRMSPTQEIKLRRAKMGAGMVLPLIFATVLGAVLGGLGRPWLALFTLVLSTATAAACAWLQVTKIKPTPRRDILTRKGGTWDVGRSLTTLGITLTGAGGLGLAASSHWLPAGMSIGLCIVIMTICFFSFELEEVQPREFSSGTPTNSGDGS